MNKIEFELEEKFAEISTSSHPLLNNFNGADKKFVIFHSPRTGSALVRNLLNSHPDIKCDGEILNHKVFSPELHIKYLSAITESKIYGCQITLTQIIGQKIDVKKFLDGLSKDGWKVIHLKRINILRKSISLMIAMERKKWHETLPLANKFQVYIDCNKLIRIIKSSEIMLLLEKKVLEELPHLDIVYEEDLLRKEKHQETMDKIFNYLNIASVPVKTKLVRTSSEHLSDFIRNYEEVVEFINKTKYDRLLND